MTAQSTSIPQATVILDNAGGITLQLGSYAHTYWRASAAAEDYAAFLTSRDASDWDGHEDEAMELDPTDDQIRSGGYRVLSEQDVTNALTAADDAAWVNQSDFISALRAL